MSSGEEIVEDAIMRGFINPTMSGPEIGRRVGSLIDEAVKAERARAEHAERALEAKDAEYREAHMIVTEVWTALGVSTFEQAGGKTVWEIVADLRAQLAQAEQERAFAEDRYVEARIQREQAEQRVRGLEGALGECIAALTGGWPDPVAGAKEGLFFPHNEAIRVACAALTPEGSGGGAG